MNDVRTEYPTQLSIQKSSKLQASVRLSNIYFDNQVPTDYDPDTALIIPPINCSKRDEALGAFMACWGQLELLNKMVLASAAGLSLIDAGPLLSLSLGPAQFQDLVDGYVNGFSEEEGGSQLRSFFQDFRQINTVRNHLVHAQWICSIQVGSDAGSRPIVEKYEWRRVYDPQSLSDRRKLATDDPATVARFSFRVRDIWEKTAQVERFVSTYTGLPAALKERRKEND